MATSPVWRGLAARLGSATNCRGQPFDPATLDVLERMEGLPLNGRVARSLLVRIVQMLTRLGARMRADAAA